MTGTVPAFLSIVPLHRASQVHADRGHRVEPAMLIPKRSGLFAVGLHDRVWVPNIASVQLRGPVGTHRASHRTDHTSGRGQQLETTGSGAHMIHRAAAPALPHPP